MTTTVVAASPRRAPTARGCTSRMPGGLQFGHQGRQLRPARSAPTRATSWVPGRISPRHQPTSRGSGATARAVTTSTGPDGLGDRPVLGAAADDPPAAARPAAASSADDLLEELHPPGHGLDQGQVDVRPGQAQRDARQTRPAADVDDPGALPARPRRPPRC